jgi:hypothetical protein
MPLLCSGCTEHHALPRLRSIASNIRTSSGYFEPKRVRSLRSDHFCFRPAVVLVTRRFPPPWSAEVQPNHYVVRDANSQQLPYVYYENEPGRRLAAKLKETSPL